MMAVERHINSGQRKDISPESSILRYFTFPRRGSLSPQNNASNYPSELRFHLARRIVGVMVQCSAALKNREVPR
jgi:hypothetical protein